MNEDSMINLSIVAAVNNDEILARNLMRSPILESDRVKLHTYYNQPSASQAYNRGLAETNSEYIAFVHQDVYLPGSWLVNLHTAISELDRIDQDWAISVRLAFPKKMDMSVVSGPLGLENCWETSYHIPCRL